LGDREFEERKFEGERGANSDEHSTGKKVLIFHIGNYENLPIMMFWGCLVKGDNTFEKIVKVNQCEGKTPHELAPGIAR